MSTDRGHSDSHHDDIVKRQGREKGKNPWIRMNPGVSGAQSRNRTNDTRIFSPLLYRLSYLGLSNCRHPAGNYGDAEGARTLDLQRDRLAF